MPDALPRRARSIYFRYLFAVLITGAALLLRLAIDNLVGSQWRSPIFSVAMLITAYFCGFGPSIIAAILSALSLTFIWSTPPLTDAAGPAFWTQLGLFIAAAIVMNIFTEKLARERDRADANDFALRRLRDEVQRNSAA